MTLVISILTDTGFYMISDSMLSVEAKASNPNDIVSYPTRPSNTSVGPRAVVGLTQKVVSIKPGLFIGWAGDWTTAKRFIDFFRICFKNSKVDQDSIKAAQRDYFRVHPEDLESIVTLVVYETEDGFALFPQGKIYVEPIPSFGELYVFGSGAKAFLDYFMDRAPQRFVPSGRLPSDIDIIHFIMAYVFETVSSQQLTGSGVGDGWGGWFEILLKKENGNFEKLDRIMYASVLWEEKDGQINIGRIGRRYFQYYGGNNLFVFSQSRGGKLQLDLIPPPDHGPIPQKIDIKPSHPQLLCLELVNSDLNERRLDIKYSEIGHGFCGLSEDTRNDALMIAFNPDRLREIIRNPS